MTVCTEPAESTINSPLPDAPPPLPAYRGAGTGEPGPAAEGSHVLPGGGGPSARRAQGPHALQQVSWLGLPGREGEAMGGSEQKPDGTAV